MTATGRGNRLTRAEQDQILMPIVLASGHVDRSICSHGNWMSYPTVNSRLRDTRAALRLDDDKLTRIIEEEGPCLSWSLIVLAGSAGLYVLLACTFAFLDVPEGPPPPQAHHRLRHPQLDGRLGTASGRWSWTWRAWYFTTWRATCSSSR